MPLETGDVVAGYSFQVEIDGVTLAQFKEVSGISSEIQVIEHRENTKGGIITSRLPHRDDDEWRGRSRNFTSCRKHHIVLAVRFIELPWGLEQLEQFPRDGRLVIPGEYSDHRFRPRPRPSRLRRR